MLNLLDGNDIFADRLWFFYGGTGWSTEIPEEETNVAVTTCYGRGAGEFCLGGDATVQGGARLVSSMLRRPSLLPFLLVLCEIGLLFGDVVFFLLWHLLGRRSVSVPDIHSAKSLSYVTCIQYYTLFHASCGRTLTVLLIVSSAPRILIST